MKLNLNVTLKTLEGLEMKEEVRENNVSVFKPLQANKVCATILYNSNEIDDNNKLKAHTLAIKLYGAKGAIEVEAEDIVLIKNAIKHLSVGLYGQIIKLIERNTNGK